MNVLMTGASGFIGSHLADALTKKGINLSLCVHDVKSAQQHWPKANIIEFDFCNYKNVSDWAVHLENIDVVINSAGIFRETARNKYKDIHKEGPRCLFEACKVMGIKKVIQVSALGADKNAFSEFHLSKRAADEYLMNFVYNWTVLVPSIVYGSGAKSMELFKAIASLPLIPLVEQGDQLIQPICIDDFVQGVMNIIEKDKAKQERVELVGPEPIAIKDVYSQLRRWLGLGSARFVSLSYTLAIFAARLASIFSTAPVSKDSILMLNKDNIADVKPLQNILGINPLSLQQYLMEHPAQQADRWHAWLYFLRPILRLSIAFLWIYTAIISAFVFPLEQSYAMLYSLGIEKEWAPILLYGAAMMDFLLGMAILFSYRIPLVAIIQIVVILIYTAIISLAFSEQWFHPFGPLSKNVPLIVATVIMIVLEKK